MNRLLLAVLFLSLADASPVGAPTLACDTLEPRHNVTTQTSPSPYAFTVVNNGGGEYQLTVELIDATAPGFKGFIAQARAAGSATSVGSYTSFPSDAHTIECHNVADTITHSINNTRTSISFLWNSGGADPNGIVFHGTAVQVKEVYWAGLASPDLGTLP